MVHRNWVGEAFSLAPGVESCIVDASSDSRSLHARLDSQGSPNGLVGMTGG